MLRFFTVSFYQGHTHTVSQGPQIMHQYGTLYDTFNEIYNFIVVGEGKM
jgi:hypothetical protein